jgi:hypothetical protein
MSTSEERTPVRAAIEAVRRWAARNFFISVASDVERLWFIAGMLREQRGLRASPRGT